MPTTRPPARKSGGKRRAGNAFCLQHGHDRHHYRRVAFSARAEKPVTIVGLQPEEGSSIPGIRRWPAEYMPGFSTPAGGPVLDIHQNDAENTMRELAVREGIFCGVSSGGAVAGALRVARATPGAIVVAIICDRGDRYLSTGVFGEEHFSRGQGFKLMGSADWDKQGNGRL